MSSAPNPPPTSTVVTTGIDRFLSVQRPVVLAHIRSIRAHKPGATPDEVIHILERRYLATVTTGGAAAGASAVIPAVGVVASLALSAAETAVFLESSALFAQSVTEIHGIAVTDPDRARALVMTLVLGSAGSDVVKQFAGEATGAAPTRTAFWGETITKGLPSATVRSIGERLRKTFVKRFAATAGGSAIGRAIPFGVGAVIGGAGNNILGRQIVRGTRQAFGPAPSGFPDALTPRERSPRRIGRLRLPVPGRVVPTQTAQGASHAAPRGLEAPLPAPDVNRGDDALSSS